MEVSFKGFSIIMHTRNTLLCCSSN